jgi:hypothetical protein
MFDADARGRRIFLNDAKAGGRENVAGVHATVRPRARARRTSYGLSAPLTI